MSGPLSKWQPTIDNICDWLLEHGKPGWAHAIEALHESEIDHRRAYERQLQAYYELKEKHEPRPKGEPYVNWTGD